MPTNRSHGLLQVLFEPDSKASDSLSYDLTAWAIPYVYNLKAFALTEQVKSLEEYIEPSFVKNELMGNIPYGYAISYSGFNELKYISAIQKKNIKTRYSVRPFSIDGSSFERGSFIITHGDNANLAGKLDRIVTDEANRLQVKLNPVSSGLVDKGKDFGSDYSPLMKKTNIAILCGEGISSGAVGELWYFFERELDYPVSLINTLNAEKSDLNDYDVLLLTSGTYSNP